MATHDFQIYISGSTSSSEDWRRAMEAPEGELPSLNDEQKEVARKFEMSESEYARGVLVHEIGEKRQQERGKKLGRQIVEILERYRPGYSLDALMRKGVDFVWLARIESAGRLSVVKIPLDIADDVIDSGDVEILNKLKSLLLGELDRLNMSAAS